MKGGKEAKQWQPVRNDFELTSEKYRSAKKRVNERVLWYIYQTAYCSLFWASLKMKDSSDVNARSTPLNESWQSHKIMFVITTDKHDPDWGCLGLGLNPHPWIFVLIQVSIDLSPVTIKGKVSSLLHHIKQKSNFYPVLCE